MKPNEVGNIIKNIRKKNNLTQQNLADQLGVTYQAVSKWENGKNIPDVAILKEISKLYNIDLNELLGNNQIKKKKNLLLIILLVIVLLIILISLIIHNKHDDFVFKTISSNCGAFKITGSIAYNKNKSSIYISSINYCGKEDKEEYKKIECYLYEKNKKTETKISACDKTGSYVSLTNYLKDVSVNINNFNLKCSKIGDNTLYLKIIATNDNNDKKTFEIPLNLNNNCSLK